MAEKIVTDVTLGDILLRKSKANRRISIRVHPIKGIIVSMPSWMPYSAGIAFLKLKREWVAEAVIRQRRKVKKAASDILEESGKSDISQLNEEDRNEIIERWRKRAKKELPPRLRELAQRYGFTVNRVAIKHNTSNWGSCSRLGNINLNLNLVRVPKELQDYVILHELCHLKYMNHGADFHSLLEKLCRDNIMREEYELSLDIPLNTKALIHRILEKHLKDYILI